MPAPISTEGRQRLRAIREAELGGRGVGGAAWAVTRQSGEGISAPTAPTAIGTAAALIGERPAGRLASAAPGASVGETAWEAIIVGASPILLPDDVLSSLASPGLAFRLRSLTDRRLHETWDVAPTTAPIVDAYILDLSTDSGVGIAVALGAL
jgi:hypothetical protein